MPYNINTPKISRTWLTNWNDPLDKVLPGVLKDQLFKQLYKVMHVTLNQ